MPDEKKSKHKLHFSLFIFLVCLLFTFLTWDHYFNSNDPLDRTLISNLILAMGSLFSACAGILVWSLETGKTQAQRKQREVEAAYQKLQDTQEQLIQAEKLASVGRVTAGAAHELNSPLITIQGYAKRLLSEKTGEESRKSLEIICRQAERCGKTVRDLLTYSRKDKPKLKLVNICSILDMILENLSLEFSADQIKITKKFPDHCPDIEADPDQIQSVFQNLIVNAWQALRERREPRELILHLYQAGHVIQTFVTDNGPGIPKESMGKIFEPFFTTKPAGKGTGLGLSLVQSIVHMHGGKIAVESETGKGTTFFVELPVHASETLRAPKTGGIAKKKILVADDDPEIVKFITTLVNAWGYDTVPASNGGEAVRAAAENNSIDLIVLDVDMPGMNGFETARRIKSVKNFSNTPIIFLTGYGDSIEARDRDTGDILSKPFNYEDLHRYISSKI